MYIKKNPPHLRKSNLSSGCFIISAKLIILQTMHGKIPSETCEIYGQNIESNLEKNFDVRTGRAEMFFEISVSISEIGVWQKVKP